MNDQPISPEESTTPSTSRRNFLRRAGLASAVAAVAPAAAALLLGEEDAQAVPATNIDADVLTFALNLEYLEAEFYLRAVTGTGIGENGGGITGAGGTGTVTVKNNPKVNFTNSLVASYAAEIAQDELNHVNFLRTALSQAGATVIARPNIDLLNSFNTAAQAAGIGNSFDPYLNDVTFLLGSFIFEDVGVTAYIGAAKLITNPAYLQAAAGILAVEAYHAGEIRAVLYNLATEANSVQTYGLDIGDAVQRISNLRGQVSNKPQKDQTIIATNGANIVPANLRTSVAFARNTRQVLDIVYGANKASQGLFFPNGLNGNIR